QQGHAGGEDERDSDRHATASIQDLDKRNRSLPEGNNIRRLRQHGQVSERPPERATLTIGTCRLISESGRTAHAARGAVAKTPFFQRNHFLSGTNNRRV